MTNDDIEEAAVDYIKKIIRGNSKLWTDLATGDKKPIVDGEVAYYSPDKSKKTAHFQWSIRAQVKGHELKSGKGFKNSPKYKLEKKYLEGFHGYNGVILFVVHIKGEEERAYYRILGPLDIEHELREMGGRASRQVKLHPFPRDHSEQCRIIQLAHEKCQRSNILVSEEMKSLVTGFQVSSVNEVDFTKPGRMGIGTDVPSHIEMILLDGNKIAVPVELQFWPEDYVPHKFGVNFHSGDVTIADAHRRFIDKEHLEIALTPDLRITLNSNFTNGTVHVSISEKLDTALTTLEFLFAWREHKYFEIEDRRLHWHLEDSDFQKFSQCLRILRDVDSLCKKLGVDTSLLRVQGILNADNLLENAVKYYVYDAKITIPGHRPQKLAVEIGEWQLRFFAFSGDAENGGELRSVGQLGTNQLWWVTNEEPISHARITPFEILSPEEISTTLNLGLDGITDAYKQYVDDEQRSSLANATVLKLIEAADLQPIRRRELLEAAHRLSDLVLTNPDFINVAKINIWQIDQRLGNLDDKNLTEIRRFRESISSGDSFSFLLKAATSILLNQPDEVDFWITEADEASRNEFKMSPIYQLHQNPNLLTGYCNGSSDPSEWEQYRIKCLAEQAAKAVLET